MMKDAHVFSHYKEAVIGAITDLAAEHEDIVFLDADLSSCIGSTSFQKAYPDRFFNCGIAEANMAGVAAGRRTGMAAYRGAAASVGAAPEPCRAPPGLTVPEPFAVGQPRCGAVSAP